MRLIYRHLEGVFEFVLIDNGQYTGSIHYTDIAGGSLPPAATLSADTTFILMPDEVVQAYWDQAKGSYNDSGSATIVFPCYVDLPDFAFAVGNGKITVPRSYINYYWPGVDGYWTGGLQSAGSGMNIFDATAIKGFLD